MTLNHVEIEKNITSSLILALSILRETPTRTVVEEKAAELANTFGYEGGLDSVVVNAMFAVDTRMGAGVSLIDSEAGHDEEWVQKRDDIIWTYSES